MSKGHILPGFALIVLLGLSLPLLAQEGLTSEPRTITSVSNNYSEGSVASIFMPDSGDNINISTFTTEAGEPGASCSAAALSHTAWFRVNHPGGTLDINTAFGTGSAFDSLVQLFSYSDAGLGSLNEIGCDDDSGGGSSANDARLVMPDLPSATYLARVSCVGLCSGTNDLALSVSYIPNEPRPVNDDVADAASINIGKVHIAANAEHATLESNENGVLSTCATYNSVWYTMTVPYSGQYSFSTFGSYLSTPFGSVTDTVMGVYTTSGGPVFTNFTEVECSDNYGGSLFGAVPSLSLYAGEQVYVRVGTYAHANMLDGTFYQFKVSPVMLPGVFTNSYFSTGLLEPWTLSVIGPVDGIVDTYSYDDTYSVRMSGAPGKTNKLKQKWSPSANGITLAKNSAILTLFYYSTNGTISSNVKAILTITYSNGTPATVVSKKLIQQNGVDHWEYGTLLTMVKSPKVANISLQIKNKSPAGQFYFDHGLLYVYGNPARDAKSADGVLPLPVAPLNLRGMN